MKDLKTTDIQLLSDIFGEPDASICIYDPNNYFAASNEADFYYHSSIEAMRAMLEVNKKDRFLLFNLSDNELLDIYCKENVGSILKFHQRNSAVFNPFATYYYLTHEDGRIACIQSPGARRVSLSLKKQAGLSARIHRSVAQQGFRMGLQRFLASGSFTFYHKGQNPVEGLLQEEEYDGFTVNIDYKEGRQLICLKAYHEGEVCQTIEGASDEFIGRLLPQ